MRKTLSIAVLGSTLLALTSIAAFAADATNDNDVVMINGGTEAVATHIRLPFHPANVNPNKLKTIYSNLGTGTDLYYSSVGAPVCGPDSNLCTQWVAMAFTPKANALVTEISPAVGWSDGTNELVIALYSDSNGAPGKAIHTWHFKNMPTFGSCCTLDTVKSKKGLAVKKGKQYWVVAATDSTDSNLFAAWNYTYNFAEGLYALSSNLGSSWNTNKGTISGLGVFGR